MAYYKFNVFSLILLFALCCPAPSTAQTDAEEDDFKLARNLFRDAGDYATAAALFADFIRNYPASPQLAEARLMLSRAYRQNGRCDLAVPAYEQFYIEHADHLSTADARRERAACLSQQGQFLPAARAFEEVQRRFSAGAFAASALLDAGANYNQGQDLRQAIAAYGRILADYATSPQVHLARYRLARLRFAAGQAEEAQQLLSQIIATDPAPSEAPSALLLSGRIDLFLGNRKAAETRFKSLEKHFPSAAQTDSAYLHRANHLYGLRLFSQAGDAYQKAFDKIGNATLKESALLGLAGARRQSLHTREALDHYQRLIAGLEHGHPAYLKARLGQAIALGQAGQFALAVGMFQGLIQIDGAPEAKDALRELGVLYKRRGDHSRSITWYRRYLQETDTASDAVRSDLAELYGSTGYYEEAIALYRELASGQGEVAAKAQFGLAQVFEESSQPRAALREYVAYLELFPAGLQSEAVRERIEYLREFTVMNQADLNRALQKAWIDELSGTPRQLAQLDVARVLFEYHDFEAAAKSFEHYAAAYSNDHHNSEAQYFLAESLLKLARQRQLEAQPASADSLRALALQEYRILAALPAEATSDNSWTQRAQIRLIETLAESGPDSLRLLTLEKGFAAFVVEAVAGRSPQLDQALLQLGDARRLLAAIDSTQLDGAAEAYRQLRQLTPDSRLVPQALLGAGLYHAQKGHYQAAADSLERLLGDYPDNPLTAQVLFELGHIRLAQERPQEAIARLQELRWGYPAFPKRRAAQKLLGDTYFQLGEFAGAIELYQPLVTGATTTDDGGRILRRIAQAYHRLGHHGEALEAYRQVLTDGEDAGLDSIYFAQAVLQLQLGQEDEAFRLFQQVRKEFASGDLAVEASTRAGHIAFVRERYATAYQIYQPLLKHSEDPLVHGQAVLVLFRLKRLEEGRKAGKNFTKRFKDATEWNQRFQLEEGQYYLRAGNYKKALAAFQKIKEGEWADDGAFRVATTLWMQNKAAPSEEGAARALEAVSRFVQEHPTSPHAADAYLRLGDYQYSLHNYLQAAGAYKRVLDAPQVARDSAQDAVWKLLKSYQGAHEYEAAHQVVNQLMHQYPEHPKTVAAQLELGIILKDKGHYPQAIEQFDELLSQQLLEANSASEARFYIGESYQNMGEYRKAIEAYYKVSYHGAEGFSQWITSADFQRARCHQSLGEHATAITVYERIVRREGGQSPQGEMAQEQIVALRRSLGNRN